MNYMRQPSDSRNGSVFLQIVGSLCFVQSVLRYTRTDFCQFLIIDRSTRRANVSKRHHFDVLRLPRRWRPLGPFVSL